MSTRNASGNSHSELRCVAIDQHNSARSPAEIATRILRPFADRSIRGPRIGETTANGAIVMSRYAKTLLFASVGETEKNSDPASETVTSVSPAIMITCTRAKRPKAVD